MKTYRYLVCLAGVRGWQYGLVIGAWIGLWGLAALVGLVIREFFDELSGYKPATLGLWGVVALIVGLEAARVISYFTGLLTDVKLRFYLSGLIRRQLLESIFARPGAQGLREAPGITINRLREDVEQLTSFIGIPGVVNGLALAVFALIALITMLQINVLLTLFVILPLGLLLTLVQLARKRFEKYRVASRETAGKVTGLLGEMFNAVQAIKVAGAENAVVARLEQLNQVRGKAGLQDRLFTETLGSLLLNSATLGTGLVLIFAPHVIPGGKLSLGDLTLFTFNLTLLSDLTRVLGTTLAQYRQSEVALQRLKEVSVDMLETQGDFVSASPFSSSVIEEFEPLENLEIIDLSYCYPESGRGIEKISLQIKRGSVTAITGPVGSGKTTLLRALLGLLPIQKGEILWNGQKVTDPTTFFVPPRSAYTPQIVTLFSETLKENILLGLDGEEAALSQALYLSVLEEELVSLETPVGAKGVKLSGGQAQRTAAARMFVRKPELLVFDDLSSGLDVETEQRLWNRVFRKPGITCLVVSNRPEVLQRADHILVLRDGRIEAEGKFGHFLETGEELCQV